jgi:hypothetical protein
MTMADTNKESTGQEPTDQADKKAAAPKKAAAEKKTGPASPESETKPVADLLISILNDVQEQVQTRAAIAAPTAAEEPLQGKALEAVKQFQEIVTALALGPTVTLTAVPTEIDNLQQEITLTWSSTFADTVSISRDDGEPQIPAEPAARGFKKVFLRLVEPPDTTTFTATATGLFCGSATAQAAVIFTGEDGNGGS